MFRCARRDRFAHLALNGTRKLAPPLCDLRLAARPVAFPDPLCASPQQAFLLWLCAPLPPANLLFASAGLGLRAELGTAVELGSTMVAVMIVAMKMKTAAKKKIARKQRRAAKSSQASRTASSDSATCCGSALCPR